ncbi:unnamed protein product [Adineta ricciae]|uniref:PX domain-containing protein kinase-like protein n=1 Tax=Adineta ricciae TaxID=249248 RepID=A0A813VRB9_ADIRI|nr:unnamed protein product [Adineta ricciae]CAF0929273.1 unnamed protein product [Adineta ricciae]
MARLIVPQKSFHELLPVDPVLPMACAIESSYIVDGHGEYSIRVARISNDPAFSWVITKRFREFVELDNLLKDYGFNFELPKKKLFGNTDPIFMAERQKGLQAYLNILVQHIELCNSLTVHRFLDPNSHLISYPESALQHVSMFVRSMTDVYQIIDPLQDFGWRYDKMYFLATKTGRPKHERYLLIWCHYGLDKALNEKAIGNCLKLLKSISHPLIAPIEDVYANESGVLTVCRFYNRGSLKDYIYRTRPACGVYWSRYGPTVTTRRCDINQIRTLGRQILEGLYFLYDNHLMYGHLHSGNILVDLEQSQTIKIVDIANVITGVSSKYRHYFSDLKHIRTLEHCDIYSFGRLLYELSTGEECPMNICTELPHIIPMPVQQILSKIFITSGELPTIEQILNEPFFQMMFLNGVERFQLTLSEKALEVFKQIRRVAEQRLENDQIKIKAAQRQSKITNHLMSAEEKLKRRREKQAKALEKQMESSFTSVDTTTNVPRPVAVNPLPSTTSKQSSPPSFVSQLSSPSISVVAAASDDRNDLLSSIAEFNVSKLKKTKTNDRSAPKLDREKDII